MNKQFINLKLQIVALNSKASALQQIISEQKPSWTEEIKALEKQITCIQKSIEKTNHAPLKDNQKYNEMKGMMKQINMIKKTHKTILKEPSQQLQSLESMQSLKNGKLLKSLTTLKEKNPELNFDEIDMNLEAIDTTIKTSQTIIQLFLTEASEISNQIDALQNAQYILSVPVEITDLSKKTDWLASKFSHLAESQEAVDKLRHDQPLLFSSLSNALSHLKLETASFGLEPSSNADHIDGTTEDKNKSKIKLNS